MNVLKSCEGCFMHGRRKHAKGVCPIMMKPFSDYTCWCDGVEWNKRKSEIRSYAYERSDASERRKDI
jgi:hypothetical protein